MYSAFVGVLKPQSHKKTCASAKPKPLFKCSLSGGVYGAALKLTLSFLELLLLTKHLFCCHVS